MKFSTEYQPENRRKPDALTPILKEWLNKDYAENLTIGEKIVQTLVEHAVNGNLKAIQLIFERIDGKPLQAISIENEMELPEIIVLPANNAKPPVHDEKDVKDVPENE